VLYRRRWTAGAAFVLVFAYGAAGSLRKAPIYEASTQLLVQEEGESRALRARTLAWRTLEGLGLGKPTTELERMAAGDEPTDRGLVERFALWLGAPRPVETPAGDETSWQSRQIDAFLGGLAVTPVPNSRVVNVTYRSADPVFAAKAANALSERYVEYGLTYRVPVTKSGDAFEADQIRSERQRLTESERALQRHMEEKGTPSVSARQENAAARRIADSGAELTHARLNRLDQEALLHRWMELRKAPDQIDTFPALRADEAAQRLWAEIGDLRAKDAHLTAAGFGPEREDRRRISMSVGQKTGQLQAQIDRLMEPVRASTTAARAHEAAMQQKLDEELARVDSRDRPIVDYVLLERRVMSHRQTHDHLVQRTKNTGLTGAAPGPNVQIVEAAEVPRRPVLPNRSRDLGIAFVLACLIGVGLAFGTEYLDSRLKNPDDIKTHLKLPFLGLVPAVSARHAKPGSLLLDKGVPPAFGEALRAVRTGVIFSTATEGPKSLMVTSTAPSEGKTVTSSNLAMALAQAELRTLVIDADMRRPRIHEVFGVEQEPGLSNVLVATAPLPDAIRPTGTPYLSVLPAGHVPPNPAELLGSPKFRKLLEDLGAYYDWIVIDAPPVMAVTDAAIVASVVRGTLFVVGAEMIPRRNAQNAIEQLVHVRAKIVGAVLNRADVDRHAYYYAPYERKEYAPVDAPRL
jgi:capsular exopolysaccharide synthesis family protein